MADAAVLFDVDGVLLELTVGEEDAFFTPFQQRYGLTGLSRDWNSYQIRNDESIIAEILTRHNLPARDRAGVISDYITIMQQRMAEGTVKPVAVQGALELVAKLHGEISQGIATANLLEAARLRLQHQNLWQFLEAHAFGADGGGHKRDIVARAIMAHNLPKSRTVYVGDNVNDLDAGLSNGVHFIGFSADRARLAELRRAGAIHLSNNHVETYRLIGHLLNTQDNGT